MMARFEAKILSLCGERRDIFEGKHYPNAKRGDLVIQNTVNFKISLKKKNTL